MTFDQWRQVKEIFEASLEREPSARAQFIAKQSGGDGDIRQAAEKMLSDFAESGDFLEAPALVEFGLDGARFDPGYDQGRRIGSYRVIGEIGQGGMGAVYLAERADDVYEKSVAIKMVWSGGVRSEIKRRFNIERRVLAALDHPNIARLMDGGVTEDGWSYVVMEYVDGAPITEFCDRRKLSFAERLQLFRSICEAVQYAHQNLIVHRDLKPSNILVTNAGEVKLLDFGIAKILDPTDDASVQSPTLLNFLTPEYASPEHIGGQRITTASDVYSLGVLLYELLTGARPFNPTSRSPQELIRLIETHEPTRPSHISGQLDATIRKQLSGDLDNIILKALQKEPLRRYQSARQLSEDIARHLNGEPVIAREATLAYRLGKRIRRNKALTVGLTLFVLALIAGLILTRWQLQASQARERQQRYELYAADMRQAGSDWGEGNLVQMDELLERHRPGNGIDDEWRGFEWFALWKLLHPEKLTVRHQVGAPTVVFTPDGKTMLTGNNEGRIEQWDTDSGRLLGVFAALPESIFQMRFFNQGTKLVVNCGDSGRLSIWDYTSRRKLAELPPVSSLIRDTRFFKLSPDETKLLTSSYDMPIQVWDTSTGQLIKSYATPAGFEIPPAGPAIYSPNGKPLCLVKRAKHFELWDLDAGRSVIRLDPQSDDLRALIPFDPIGHFFSPDGERYYLATQDFKIRAWDFKRGGKPLLTFSSHEDQVEPPVLSRDGKLMASGSDDRTLRLWDTQTGQLLVTVKNASQTFAPVFSADDRFLAAVNVRVPLTRVWDVQTLLLTPQFFPNVMTTAVSPDGKAMLTEGWQQQPMYRIWITEPVLRELQTGQRLLAYKFGAYYACSGFDCAKYSPDGKMLAIRRDSGENQQRDVVILESATGNIQTDFAGHTGCVNAVCFSPDGKTLATGGWNDALIKLRDTMTWREQVTLTGHKGSITSLDFSPDGSKLVSSGYDATKVWDIMRGKELFTLKGHRSWVLKARFSPDGRFIATAGWDFTIKLWDAMTGREVHTLKGHANSVYAIAFSPNGKRLASGSDDRTVRVWDMETGTELISLRGHTGKVWQVFFAPDGKTLISSGEDGTRIWRAATEEEVRALPVNR